jgi:hypothetical protein
MRRPDVIVRETYEQNQQTFSNTDRFNAQRALNVYMPEINSGLLRDLFDCMPGDINSLLRRPREHRVIIDRLKSRSARFKDFIDLTETLGDRRAVTLNPLWWSADDAPETIERALDPQAIIAYRAFHAALVVYLDALSAENPNWHNLGELICQVAYTVNPNKWGKADAPAQCHGIAGFNTRWFLEAIVMRPQESVD